MAIDRRQFLGFGAWLLPSTRLLAGEGRQRLLSCRSNDEGQHYLSLIGSDGQLLIDIRLPERGHGVAVEPEPRRAAVFARRPGAFVWIVDLSSGRVVHKISAAPGRHFYGHGLYTADGSTLLCSESDYESGDGVIGVYDASERYLRVGEFPSYGIGPHEIKRLANGRTLVVANGGIRTHPDLPRVKLNLASMRPNLAYVEIASGRLLHKHEPERKWHQLSIRHIDVSSDDQVMIAMQFEGKPQLLPPLIAIQKHDQAMEMLSAPVKIQRRLRNYWGSVAFCRNGKRFAVSSPRGGLVTYWSAEGDFLGTHDQVDACGISHVGNREREFLSVTVKAQ